MRRDLIVVSVSVLIAGAALLASGRSSTPQIAFAQALPTTSPQAGSAFITNTYSDEPFVNVRTGPNTATYQVCGSLAYGASAVALGTTPAHVWVQIELPDCPGGVGWVYAAFVTLNGTLRVVEPPATPQPASTPTLDPTLVAAFQSEPTVTRLPTFTPPAPVAWPTFTDTAPQRNGMPPGMAILALTLVAAGVLISSSFARR